MSTKPSDSLQHIQFEGCDVCVIAPEDYDDTLDRLSAENQRLREALKPLALIPVQDFGKETKPDYPLMGWNNHMLYVHDVLRARAALEAKP